MFIQSRESTPPPYPIVDGLRVNIDHQQHFSWGSIGFTRLALLDYQINVDAFDEGVTGNPPFPGFNTEILVAAPEELDAHPAQWAVGGAEVYRHGARVTVGLSADKDVWGMNLTSQKLQDITNHMPPEHVTAFLQDHGVGVQDQSAEQYTHAVTDVLSSFSATWTFNAYMAWKSSVDRQMLLKSINRMNLIYIGAAAVVDVIDYMADKDIEPTVAAGNVLAMGAMANSIRKQLKQEIVSGQARQHQNQITARRLATIISSDVHELLYPQPIH
jgi:hypothetical protein